MLIDSHAHLDLDSVKKDDVISNMDKDGLLNIITIGTDVKRSQIALNIAKENDRVYAVVGFHPDFAHEYTKEDLNILEKMLTDKKVVGVGEIGLDYHDLVIYKEKQKQMFVDQIMLADKYDLPLVLHIRDATGDAIKILLEYKKYIRNGGVAHCFSGSLETAKILINLGFYISFSGRITFKNVDREILKDIPIDRIIVETDSPFLSPEPVRGTVNVPKNVNYTAKRIADFLDINLEKFCQITVDNTKRVFKKIK